MVEIRRLFLGRGSFGGGWEVEASVASAVDPSGGGGKAGGSW